MHEYARLSDLTPHEPTSFHTTRTFEWLPDLCPLPSRAIAHALTLLPALLHDTLDAQTFPIPRQLRVLPRLLLP